MQSNIFEKMTLTELQENEAAAMMLLQISSSELLKEQSRRDLFSIRRVMQKKYAYNWLREHQRNTKRH